MEDNNPQSPATDVIYDVILLPELPESDPSKTGNKPKKLVATEVFGYEVGRGLRKRIVTPDDVFKLAAIGLNDREIARWYDIKEDTLRYNFADIIQKGREDMKMSLRRAMLHNAIHNNNPALQIFLAKNILGMSDSPINEDNNRVLPWTDDEDAPLDSDD
tara:strand:- start:578 stop:1057 length:480 start_codon:yes stop_codon:yes gene_type:complete